MGDESAAMRLRRLKPVHWLALAAGGLVLGAGAVLILRATGAWDYLRSLPVRAWVEQIAQLGPLPFLAALAVLPAVGAPVSIFYLIAGAVFKDHGGLGMALLGCFAAIAVNLALTYSLGRWLMHPVIEAIVRRFGWKVPKVRFEDRRMVTLLMRITPGPPFFVQSYLLALGGVPFGSYMLVSFPIVCLMSAGVIVFGESLVSGSGAKLLFGVLFIVAAILIVRLVRKRVTQRHPQALAEVAGEDTTPAAEQPPARS